LIKNSQPFGKKFQKTVGGIFLTHTVHVPIEAGSRINAGSRMQAGGQGKLYW